MSEGGKLPVGQAVNAAYSFIPQALPKALPAYGLYALIAGFLMQSSMALQTNDAAGAAYLLAFILTIGLGIAASAMLYRYGLNREYSGLFGLKFGTQEWCLLGANALLVLLLLIVSFIVTLFLSILFGIFFASSGVDVSGMEEDPQLMADAMVGFLGTAGGFVFLAICAGVVAVIFYIFIRLMLFGVASVDQQRVAFLSTFEWTRGNAGRMALALLAILPLYIVGIALYFAVMNMMGISFLTALSPQSSVTAGPGTFFVLGVISTLVNLPFIVSMHGLSVFLYQGFKPTGPRISEAFD